VRILAAGAVALVLAGGSVGSTGPLPSATAFLTSVQRADGGFAEAGGPEDPSLTAWAALALVAGGAPVDDRARALAYLRSHEADVRQVTDDALVSLARSALGDRPVELLARLRAVAPGAEVNAEIWTIIALRAASEPAPGGLVRDLLSQARGGGWSWVRGGQPDSNDTAAAIEALRAAGVTGEPIARGVAALRRFQNRDGGYGLSRGRASDAQSTAWAIQALLAAGAEPQRSTWRFLSRLRRPDGSYRYSAAYATTPVWVTAQVTPALAGRWFPLQGS